MAITTTPYGVELRKIRVDHGETQKDMADKLKVSATFLSMVELGKRKIPAGMTDKIAALYHLQPRGIAQLRKAENRSTSSIYIDLENASQEKKDAAVALLDLFATGEQDDFKELLKFVVSKIYG